MAMLRTLSLMIILALMSLSPAWASMASIGKDNVNVRSGPSLKANVLFKIHFGFPVEVQKTKGSWVQIKDWDGQIGWVYRPLINKKVQTAMVLPDKVNIRKGPGLRYRVVSRAEGGEIYKVFAEKGSWVRIGYYLENQPVS